MTYHLDSRRPSRGFAFVLILLALSASWFPCQIAWYRCGREARSANRVGLLCEAAFRFLRHYKCGVSFVRTGVKGDPRVGSPCEAPWRCTMRRSGGPSPNARPRLQAGLSPAGAPSEAPLPG